MCKKNVARPGERTGHVKGEKNEKAQLSARGDDCLADSRCRDLLFLYKPVAANGCDYFFIGANGI